MRDAAIGIILEKESGKVLLIKREDTPIWVLPGGGIDPGETAEEAVIREILEETGLKVSIIRKCAEYEPINSFAAKTYVFECASASGSLQIGEETEDLGYFSLDNLPKPTFFIHEEWIKEIFESPDKMVKKQITQVTLKNIFLYFIKHPLIFSKFAISKFKTRN